MASVLFAAHISRISGSIENTTYSRNRPGNFMRQRIVPRDPALLSQLTQRGHHATVVDYWRNTMTNDQRIVWNDLALLTTFNSPTCRAYHPSGFSLFLRANVFRLTMDSAIEPVPDAVAAASPTTFTLAAGAVAGEPYITADADWPDGKAGYVKIWYSIGMSQCRYYFRGPWADWRDTTIALIADLPFRIGQCGAIADGQRIWLKFKAFYGTQGTIITWPQHTYWDYNV